MSLTESNMLPLGTTAPDFTLLNPLTGKNVSLAEIKSPKGTVIMFICNHCPYVKHIQEHMAKVAKTYQKKGIAFIAISSNDVDNYPEDSPELMAAEAKQHGYTFPYLYDESQQIAKAYKAACTPDFYVFDGAMQCFYRGRFDDATPGKASPVTGKDLTTALDALLANQPPPEKQIPSMGCNIKWKK